MLVAAFVQVHEQLFTFKIIKLLLSIVIILGITYLILKNKNNAGTLKVLLGLGLLFAFLVRLRLVLTIDAPLKSDFAYMYNAANYWLEGNKDAFKTAYYDFAVFNIPFSLYLAFFIKYLGGLLAIKVMNVIWSVGIIFFIYKITKQIFGIPTAIIALFIASFFPPLAIYTTLLTNQTISIFFIMIGLYFLICRKNLLLCSLFIGLGHIFRPIGTVFILATIGYIILQFISHKDLFTKEHIKHLIVSMIKIIVPYQMMILIVSALFLLFQITPNTLYHNPAPSYKLLVGVNAERTGQWNKDDADLLKQSSTTNFEILAKQRINERTEDKIQLAHLLEEKFKIMWGKPDEVFFWTTYDSSGKKTITNYFWLTILFFCLCFTVFQKRELLTPIKLYIFISLLGFITAYTFIEIQTRYRYEIYPLFIIISSQGIILTMNYINNKRSLAHQ